MAIQPPPCRWNLPDPALAMPGQEVLAIGADLSVGTVFAAYQRGLFPMHLATGELAWWSPDPRGILRLADLHVSRSLRKSMGQFRITIDTAFTDVMRACADTRRDHGWITPEFVDTYTELHRLGWAHSVETWSADGQLVGGLYGIEIGGLFAGESMFHLVSDASKAALVGLVEALRAGGGERLLDVQWRTDHLATMGVVEIPREEYLARLRQVQRLPGCLDR